MQIDESEKHFENASGSISDSLASDANVTVERDSHSEKQQAESRSTKGGMQIDRSRKHLSKTECSISESLESHSNVTVDRESHSLKQQQQS
jgi:hypothetical protein